MQRLFTENREFVQVIEQHEKEILRLRSMKGSKYLKNEFSFVSNRDPCSLQVSKAIKFSSGFEGEGLFDLKVKWSKLEDCVWLVWKV